MKIAYSRFWNRLGQATFGTRQKWWPHSTVNVLYVTEFLLFEVPDFMFFGWPLN